MNKCNISWWSSLNNWMYWMHWRVQKKTPVSRVFNQTYWFWSLRNNKTLNFQNFLRSFLGTNVANKDLKFTVSKVSPKYWMRRIPIFTNKGLNYPSPCIHSFHIFLVFNTFPPSQYWQHNTAAICCYCCVTITQLNRDAQSLCDLQLFGPQKRNWQRSRKPVSMGFRILDNSLSG